jgi:hypothetical protein
LRGRRFVKVLLHRVSREGAELLETGGIVLWRWWFKEANEKEEENGIIHIHFIKRSIHPKAIHAPIHSVTHI